jgi:hypothetical protein
VPLTRAAEEQYRVAWRKVQVVRSVRGSNNWHAHLLNCQASACWALLNSTHAEHTLCTAMHCCRLSCYYECIQQATRNYWRNISECPGLNQGYCRRRCCMYASGTNCRHDPMMLVLMLLRELLLLLALLLLLLHQRLLSRLFSYTQLLPSLLPLACQLVCRRQHRIDVPPGCCCCCTVCGQQALRAAALRRPHTASTAAKLQANPSAAVGGEPVAHVLKCRSLTLACATVQHST